MSLILDALRKMEQERRSRRGAANDLRPEVLRYHQANQPKEPARYPVLLVGAALLCLGIGAGVLLKGNRNETPKEEPVAAPLPAAPLPAAPAVAPAAPIAVPAPQPAAAVTAGVPSVQGEGAASQARSKSSRASSYRSAAAEGEGGSPRETAAVQSGAPDIVISGIAYQDERRMRRAVLNGVLVGEGAEIAGARVVEIKETKVRLSRGGQTFELPFSSGLQSR
ncbi:general secretion pathway protein GspB [Citrifermentans bremense]|uniref:general secretion pathway protein GspB n=1 Tax=Citrifermentans bremense TaxID=60035 RepID=UPI0003FF19F0|nr:general secretion pathway protein GspB [Citrifermentans bremense]